MSNKFFTYILLLSAACGFFSSCRGNSDFAGGSMIDEQTTIINAYADTFLVTSHLIQPKGIITSPDSFLLGEVETSYGTMHAEIFTQMACPLGYSFPANAEVDSIEVYLYYDSWVGDGDAPLELEIREMDRGAIYYWQRYQSNFAIEDFCSMEDSTLITETNRIVVASRPTDSIYQSSTGKYMPYLRFRTTPQFAARFGTIRSFPSQDLFNQQFRGLFIRSVFGSSTVLNVSDIGMAVFYHFTYDRVGVETRVDDSKMFYSNTEVRQINHIEYRDADRMFSHLSADTLRNYVISPAGMYTGLHIPVQSIAKVIFDSINQSSFSRPYINKARVMVHVENVYSGSAAASNRDLWEQPAPQMLLIDSAHLNQFFVQRNLTSDTTAILSSLSSGLDAQGETFYYYSFDLSTILMNQLRRRDTHDFYFDPVALNSLPDTINMVLVPVTASSTTSSSSGSTSLLGIDEQQTISTTIISASRATNPMRLELVYSGFPYNW